MNETTFDQLKVGDLVEYHDGMGRAVYKIIEKSPGSVRISIGGGEKGAITLAKEQCVSTFERVD